MQKDEKEKTLVLIDGHALVHRAYHALPPLTTPKGELVNAVYGFVLVLLRIFKELKPDYLAATFDLAAPTFRHKEFEDYKATRAKAPDELYAQIGRVKEILGAFNVPIFEKEGFEADDIIGTLARTVNKKHPAIKSIIVTGDLDTLQLINEKTYVFTLRKGVRDTILYDEKAVMARYGLRPEQIVDFKGLKGDPSDNIPGVPGIGEKTAADLLKKYGSIENLYKEIEKPPASLSQKPASPASPKTTGRGGPNLGERGEEVKKLKKQAKTKDSDSAASGKHKLFEKLAENKEQAFFSKYLATIKTDAPIKFNLKDAVAQDFDKENVVRLFKELGFYSLVNRLGESPLQGIKPEATQASMVSGKNDVYEKIEEAYKQGVFSKQIYELEKALVPAIEMMEKNGIKIDVEFLKKLGKKVGGQLGELEQKIYKSAGVQFNINSPQQLSEILFGKLGLAVKGLKKTPGKVISTAASELEKMRGSHEIISFIMEYRELAKLKNTYIDALPKLVSQDGRLHTSYDQLGAATGRLSSKNPNLQNIPIKTELGREIRKAFIAEKGYKILSVDYSQIELRVISSIARDKNMIEAFKQGKDIHTLTAAEVFETSPGEVTPDMRKAAKTLNFGVIYGMSIHGFAQAAGVDSARAKAFIEKYFKEFDGIARYIEETKKSAAKTGYVQTLFGRKRHIPEINSSAWNLRASAERMAINMPIQGTAADLMKMAMVKIAANKLLLANCRLLLQVHDELVFEVVDDKTQDSSIIIRDIMENIYNLESFLKVDIKVGANWGELK